MVKGCISSPVLDHRDSSRIHILLLSDSKTILNKMQVYLFSFLFVLSFYHTLSYHYSPRSQPLFITSLQFFQDFSNIFIHINRLSRYFCRCICFTLIQTHIKCMLKCVCHLPERIFYNTGGVFYLCAPTLKWSTKLVYTPEYYILHQVQGTLFSAFYNPV